VALCVCKCRDLKSSNVLLSADGRTAKVADVGAAAMMDAEYISQHFGTLAWAAPELLLADRASQLDEKVMLRVGNMLACHLPGRSQRQLQHLPAYEISG
jgi:serine/threonine protein kinase